MTDREWTRKIATEAEAVLAEHFANRLEVRRGNARYGPGNATVKFTFARVGDDGKAMTPERQAFERFAARHGLDPEDLGRTFRTLQGDRFAIVGLNTRARTYPVIAERADGKRFKFSASQVKAALARTNGEG